MQELGIKTWRNVCLVVIKGPGTSETADENLPLLLDVLVASVRQCSAAALAEEKKTQWRRQYFLWQEIRSTNTSFILKMEHMHTKHI